MIQPFVLGTRQGLQFCELIIYHGTDHSALKTERCHDANFLWTPKRYIWHQHYMKVQIEEIQLCRHWRRRNLSKTGKCHDTNFAIAGGIGGLSYDNLAASDKKIGIMKTVGFQCVRAIISIVDYIPRII